MTRRSIEFGVRIPCYRRWCRRDETMAIAISAERLGFASLWVQDHLVAPVGTADETRVEGLSPWMEGERPQTKTAVEYYAGDDWWLDPYATWGFLAGVTSRVRLASDILVLPYRHPVVQAKLIGTLDVLSGGRMIIGTGTGHVPAEAAALDIDFSARGRLHDEYLRIITSMLSNEEVAFDGEFHRFGPVRTMIRPLQTPHPPFWIGGNGPRAIRRAAELGQAWLPSVVGPDALSKGIAELHRVCDEIGRDNPPPVALSMPSTVRMADPEAPPTNRPPMSPQEVVDLLGAYVELGVVHISLAFPTPNVDVYLRQMELFASQVLPHLSPPAAASDHQHDPHDRHDGKESTQ